MQKWEYKVHAIGGLPDLDFLKGIGAEGWEMCGTIPLPEGYAMIFKRTAPEEEKPVEHEMRVR